MSSINEAFTDIMHTMSLDQRDWQDKIGFGEEGNLLREINVDIHKKWDALARTDADAKQQLVLADAALRNYYIAKLALITTEVAEAIEEIRHNHAITETYYSDTEGKTYEGGDVYDPAETLKPEGVPSELADIVIRCLSLAGEANINLGEAIVEKLRYNQTRAQKHGGKAI